MTETYRIPGNASVLQSVIRGCVLIAAAIGGFFMLAFSAAIAFFVVAGVAVVGFLAFAFFWARAKILGRPFGPKAKFEAQRNAFEAQFGNAQSAFDVQNRKETQGPIIDAHETPKGWSVDD